MSVPRAARSRALVLFFMLAVGLAAGCGGSQDASESVPGNDDVEPGRLPASHQTVIVVLGDSLTAGLGLMAEESFPTRLQQMFANEGYGEVELLNAGVSGDTTAGGLRRVESLIAPNVRILVVALGSNDALRGLSVSQTRQNLATIIEGALAAGVEVMLTGMEGPTNLGEDYRTGFRDIFSQLAAEYRGRIMFVPFLLEGVAGHPDLNQADGIHPNARGAELIAEQLYPRLRDMVDQLPTTP